METKSLVKVWGGWGASGLLAGYIALREINALEQSAEFLKNYGTIGAIIFLALYVLAKDAEVRSTRRSYDVRETEERKAREERELVERKEREKAGSAMNDQLLDFATKSVTEMTRVGEVTRSHLGLLRRVDDVLRKVEPKLGLEIADETGDDPP